MTTALYTYGVQAGRCITRTSTFEGSEPKPFVTIHGAGNDFLPTQWDDLARAIPAMIETLRGIEGGTIPLRRAASAAREALKDVL